MMKKILLLMGSPRKDGNTQILAEAFSKGANQAGYDIKCLNVTSKNIKGCIACNSCRNSSTTCRLDDDFAKEIAPFLEEADAIVFATPLYWFGFPSQIKAVIDKLYAYVPGQNKKQLNIKEALLIVCGACTEESYFQGIINTYDNIVKYMQWSNKGSYVVPGVNDRGDVKANTIEQIEKIGNNF